MHARPDPTRRRRHGVGHHPGRSHRCARGDHVGQRRLGRRIGQQRLAAPSRPPSTGIKAKANTDITDRVNDLNAAIAKVNAAKGLGSGQATLVAYLGTDIAPLQQLNQKIQGDTTVKQAAQDFSARSSPTTASTSSCSRRPGSPPTPTGPRTPRSRTLTADSAKAQGLVNPQNQAQLQPLIDDLNSQISTATNATNGLAATVLAFTPAQWNANNNLLSPSRSADQTADAALQKGRSDVQQIRQVLKGSAAAAPRPPPRAEGHRAAGHVGTTTHDLLRHIGPAVRRGARRAGPVALRQQHRRVGVQAVRRPWSGARPGTRRTRPGPTGRSPRRCRST